MPRLSFVGFPDMNNNAPINVKPAGAGEGQGMGWGFDSLCCPWGRAFDRSCSPGGVDI